MHHKKPKLPINIPSQKKPNIFQELKPVKIDDPEPTPPPKPDFGGTGALTSSDVQIKDLNDDNFFGGGKNNNGFNGIKFMGSQIASFNDIPTLNSKIVKPKTPKIPSINKIGEGGLISKIFNPAVSPFIH